MTADEKMRRIRFEVLVLEALWMIIRLLVLGHRQKGVNVNLDAEDRIWRSNVCFYLDEHGKQGDEAKAYRRSHTFPDLP